MALTQGVWLKEVKDYVLVELDSGRNSGRPDHIVSRHEKKKEVI